MLAPLFCAVGWYGEFTRIDASSGNIGPSRTDLPDRLQALAWSPGGTLYAGASGTSVNSGSLYTIDPATGSCAYVRFLSSDIRGMAFSSSGVLYVTAGDMYSTSTPFRFRTIDLASGSITSDRALWGAGTSAQGLDFSPSGNLYAVTPHAHTAGTYDLFTVDLDDAEMHLVGSYSTANLSQSIAFAPDGSLYAIGESTFAQLNPTTGQIIAGSQRTVSGDYRGLACITGAADTTPPTVTNRVPAAGATLTTSSVNIDLTFSEAVKSSGSGAPDAADMVLGGTAKTAGTSVGTVTNVSGNTWRFPVSGLSSGTLSVSLAPDANDIEDLAGNDLAPVTWSYTVSVSVVADAGGSYAISEGQSLTLDGSGSTAGSSATYEWDVDGDNDYDEAITGKTVTLTWAQLQALNLDDGPYTGNVTLRVTDSVGGVVFAEDFDPAIGAGMWSSISNGVVGNVSGTTSTNVLYFDGSGSRYAATKDLNVSAGGQVQFGLRIGTSYYSPWEDADSGENVVLEYSTNGGSSWTILRTYSVDSYPSFTSVTETIPTGAQTASTRFRWNQPSHSGISFDNWGIDNVQITASGGGGGGGVDTDTTTLSINNVLPVVSAPANQTASEGTARSFTLGSFTDPGDDALWLVTVAWGDSSSDTFNRSAPGSLGSMVHTYASSGAYSVTVTVREDDGAGAAGSTSFQVNVASVPPTVTGLSPAAGVTLTTSSVNIDVTFSEAVKSSGAGAPDATDMVLSGTAKTAGTSVGTVTNVSGNTWRFPVSGLSSGTLSVGLAPDANDIEDLVGNDLAPVTWSYTVSVSVVADAGGSYAISEGQSLTLDGSGSTASSSATYEWDVDGDNDYDEAITGKTVTLTWAQLQALNLDDGPYTGNVTLRVTDAGGGGGSAIVNGGFEAGSLSGWSRSGNASVVTSSFGSGPTEGTYEALLTTGSGAVSAYSLESFLGISSGTLNGLGNGYATEGTAIKQTFTARAGDVVSFDWNFLTNEATPASYNDFAFVTIAGTSELADTGSTFVFSPTSYNEETGFRTFRFTISASGTYRLGIGVVDEGDSAVESALLIDHVYLPGASGGVDADTTTLSISNLPPTVTLIGPAGAEEGQTGHYTFTTSDPGADTFSLVVGSPDGGSVGTVSNLVFDSNTGAGSFDVIFSDGPAISTVSIQVKDSDDALSNVSSIDVEVANVAPVVAPLTLSAVTVDENGTVTVSGSFTDVGTLDTHTVVIDWGGTEGSSLAVVTEAGGTGTFTASHQYLDDNPTGTLDEMPITVTVTDDDMGSDTEGATVTVNNVAPVIGSLDTNATVSQGATEGQPISLSAAFTDVGTLDTHTAQIDWGDGTNSAGTVKESLGAGSVAAEHTYAAGGVYTITVTLSDDDGGTDTKTALAVVSGAGVNGGVLYVIGTDNDDRVTINKQGNGLFKVHANFFPEGNFRTFNTAGVEAIVVLLYGGSDQATVAGSITAPTLLDGGSGNDRLNGGAGANIILGDSGDDELIGGGSHDILIGGEGRDRLVGNGGDDVLAAGGATVDSEPDVPAQRFDVALLSLLADWNSSRSLGNRLHAYDDGVEDVLTGAAGQDWFFAHLQGLNQDKLTDRKADELVAVI